MNTFNPQDFTILVVDDVPKNIQVLGNILGTQNYEVEYTLNGHDALESFEKYNYDLVLLDVMMPGIDGFQVCKTIRQNNKYKDIPIIFLTAKTDKESVVKGFQIGAQDYVTKPFDSNELLARVKTHLELKVSKQRLKETNKWLEKKVAERTRDLKIANKKLLELDTAKSEFLKIISHEIRTPLNGILGGLSLINEYGLSEETETFLEILNSSATRLEGFAYKALDISLFNSKGSDAISKTTTSIEEVLNNAVLGKQKDADKKKMTVNIQNNAKETTCEADSGFMQKCFSNIIDNAINFGEEQSEIKITLETAESNLLIRIENEGSSFPVNFDINKIAAFTGNHVDKNPGLSLFLCKQIIQAHDGKIGNRNTENGALVKIQIPT